MEAGRELDALVAEKVMNWTCSDVMWINVRFEGTRVLEQSGKMECPNYGGFCESHCPRYSTDIAEAKDVQAVITAKGFKVWVTAYPNGNEFFCEWTEGPAGIHTYIVGPCETEALAICLAALKVVGG